jgi:hypothetical protein
MPIYIYKFSVLISLVILTTSVRGQKDLEVNEEAHRPQIAGRG